jgi:hypothetical protein
MILAQDTARLEPEAKLANAGAEAALIAYYKLEIEKLKQLYGARSERKARLLEQMELQLGRRSLLSLQELTRLISDQVGAFNAFLRGHYAHYGVAGNLVKVHRAVERYWHRM